MSDDETYAEGLTREIAESVEELADLNDEEVVEATIHRNTMYGLQTALMALAHEEMPDESMELMEKRTDVVSHALALLDGQCLADTTEVGNTPSSAVKDLADEGDEGDLLNFTIRLPRTMAITAFMSSLNMYFDAPRGSGTEKLFGGVTADLHEEWPGVSAEVEDAFDEKLGDESMADVTSDFTTIDIDDPTDNGAGDEE